MDTVLTARALANRQVRRGVGIGRGESVEEAICLGWVDGLINGTDDVRFKHRFTPRNPDNEWSKTIQECVQAMVETAVLTPAGIKLVETAHESGGREETHRLADDPEIPDELEIARGERDGPGELPALLELGSARLRRAGRRGEDGSDEGASDCAVGRASSKTSAPTTRTTSAGSDRGVQTVEVRTGASQKSLKYTTLK